MKAKGIIIILSPSTCILMCVPRDNLQVFFILCGDSNDTDEFFRFSAFYMMGKFSKFYEVRGQGVRDLIQTKTKHKAGIHYAREQHYSLYLNIIFILKNKHISDTSSSSNAYNHKLQIHTYPWANVRASNWGNDEN